MKKNKKLTVAVSILFSMLICLPAFGGTTRHTYDDLNRLVRTDYENADRAFSLVYTYDRTGNRKSEEIIVAGSPERYCKEDSECGAGQVCRENTARRFNASWEEDIKICVPENCGDWDAEWGGCLFGEGRCGDDSDCGGSLECESGICSYCTPETSETSEDSEYEEIAVVSYTYDNDTVMRLTVMIRLKGTWAADVNDNIRQYVNVWIDKNNDGEFGNDEHAVNNISQKVADSVDNIMVFETEDMDISDIETETAAMRVILTMNNEHSDPCTVGGYGDARTVILHFPMREIEADCGSPTVVSANNGTWGSPSSWNPQRVPDENDIVLIREEHIITDDTADSDPISVRGLCNDGILMKDKSGPLHITATGDSDGGGFIYNNRYIFGYSHISGFAVPHQYSDYKEKGDNGGSIRLEADSLLYNNGFVRAGDGEPGYLEGGDGGSLTVTAAYIIQTFLGTFASGSGGDADAHQTLNDDDPDNDRDFINKSVFGGSGGSMSLTARKSFRFIGDENAGIIGGEGGDATVYHTGISPDPGILAEAGEGSDMTLIASDMDLRSFKAESGSSVYIDPDTVTAGPDTHVSAGEDVVIFGGNNWVLNLRGMSKGAVTAGRDITLSVGKGGVIDLREISDKVFGAGGRFRVFSDTVLLDEGVSLGDLADAGQGIETGPAKILRRVALNGPGQMTGHPGADVSVRLTLVNAGPEEDTYTLSVTDPAGWNPKGLPSSLTLGGLEYRNLTLDMTLPSAEGETNVMVIRAVSVSDPDTAAEAEVTVSALYPKNSGGAYIVALEDSPFRGDALTVYRDHPAVRPDAGTWELTADIAQWADYEGLENSPGFEIHGTDGSDRIYGSPGNDVIFGYGGDDFIESREGDDSVSGGAGDDTLNGGAGDNVLSGGTGTDRFTGGTDSDVTVPGDADGNGTVDLRDALSVIRVLVELDADGLEIGADVNRDNKIGAAEFIYILQKISR